MIRLPAGRLLTRPLPPVLFAARAFAAVMRPPLLFFAIGSLLGVLVTVPWNAECGRSGAGPCTGAIVALLRAEGHGVIPDVGLLGAGRPRAAAAPRKEARGQ